MTERLYYRDSHLVEFDASVLGVESGDGHSRVRLDRTAFYPTSGGQPFDVGVLGGSRVIDVVEADDGAIVHVVEGEFGREAQVHGRIDWARRFDHMQQHTGQHILSAAFATVLDARTESFHLGAESATIDLSRELSAAEIGRAEADANRVVWEDHPVEVKFVDAQDAAKLPLRKESGRTGTLRLIGIEDYDLSACGGTHVRRTGAVGAIAVAGWEKFRTGSRVEFVCGGRALRRFGRLREVVTAATKALSVHRDELPSAIERIQVEAREARRRLKDAQLELAGVEGQRLADAASDGVVVAGFEGWDQAGLKAIASAITARPGCAVALFGLPAPSAIVVTRSADLTVDCAEVLRQAIARFGGKGGGRADLAQGGGLNGTADDVAECLRTLLGARAL